MARLLDKKVDGKFPFEYRGSASTDVKATIERARARQAVEEDLRRKREAVAADKVSKFERRGR